MYDFSWHERHGHATSYSARRVLGLLRDGAAIGSMLDVGCGDGRWLEAASGLGVAEIQGVDGPWTEMASLRIPHDRFRVCDFSNAFDLGRRFDLVSCLEVAEHVATEHSERLVERLTRHGDLVLFGAAIPFQGGYRHINEQWQSWWADLFARRGYRAVDVIRPRIWKDDAVHYWYRQNMLLYVADAKADLAEAMLRDLVGEGLGPLPLDIVHPEKFEAIASYRQIAFKPLATRLPQAVLRKAAAVTGLDRAASTTVGRIRGLVAGRS